MLIMQPVSWLHSRLHQIKGWCVFVKAHRHLFETNRRPSEFNWWCMCASLSNSYTICYVKSFLSPHFTILVWMNFNSQVNPALPWYEYACLFFGIYPLNGLERDVRSHFLKMPCFGRCFEVKCMWVWSYTSGRGFFFFQLSPISPFVDLFFHLLQSLTFGK